MQETQRSNQKAIRFALAAIFVAVSFFLSACAEKGDQELIEHTLAAISEAVEEKDFTAVHQYLDDGFIANERMGVDEVKQLLRFYSLRHKKLNVTIVGSNTTLHANLPDRAYSTVSVIATGSSGLLPSDGSIRQVEVEWTKHSGDWLIRKASWRR
ncbi:MAG: hypothetical protein AB8C02_18465 [Halioglobus sp.]